MSNLEYRLRRTASSPAPPPDLHDSIIQAVRNCRAPGQAAPRSWCRPSLAAAVLVWLVAWAGWWTLSRPPAQPDLLTTATATLERSRVIPQEAQFAMLSPLSQEMEFLGRDLRNAVDFLVASLP
jgi:hypothetical protein